MTYFAVYKVYLDYRPESMNMTSSPMYLTCIPDKNY